MLVAVQQDADTDLLWLIFHVADSEYRATRRVSDRESRVDIVARGRFFDTIVEVIDVRARALVASRRFDESLSVVGSGLVRTLGQEEDGTARFTAWHMRLAGRH